MVVVQGAFAACAHTTRDGVVGQLAMVVVSREQRHRGQAALGGLTLPRQISAGGFVFAPGKSVDAFARVGSKVVFKQTARRVRVQVGVHQRSAQPGLVAQVVVATQCERVFFATAVLLPVVGIALRTVVRKPQTQITPGVAGARVHTGKTVGTVVAHAHIAGGRA